MKTLIAIATLVMSGAAFASPTTTLLPVKHVFSPSGFDSNDNVEVMVSGYLPDLCHKAPNAKVKVFGNKIFVQVEAIKEDETVFCPQVVLPFLTPVSVGMLDKGNYEVVVNPGSSTESTSNIKIAESTSAAIDDYIYANVNYVEQDANTRVVTLKGYNPSPCFELDQIKHTNNKADTYSVLPVLKQVTAFCPEKMVPFTYKWTVPKELNREEVLLHVRVMDGKSVNTLFEDR